MTDGIVRKGKAPYGIVPFALLECHSLSPLARLVAVWIESKPEGWIVRPAHLQQALGISAYQWRSARKEMIEAGIFTHTQRQTPAGKWDWTSEFNASPLLATIPNFFTRGEVGNIEVRVNKQRTEAISATAPDGSLPFSKTASKENLHELKKLHVGHVLNVLEIEWWQEGGYICWGNHDRARQADDGHWLWYRVDGHGEEDASGSAIDLIMEHDGCTKAVAIKRLRDIYRQALEHPTKAAA